MRPTLLSMIAPSSLSAFSATNGVAPPGAIQPVRGQSPLGSAPLNQTRPGAGPQAASPPATSPAPGQILPRGSLLDLSV